MTLLNILNYTAFVIGILAVLYPVYFAIKFRKVRELGNAISYMFWGEAWGVAVVVIFAALAMTHTLTDLDGYIQVGLRMSAFIAALATSFHLKRRIDSFSKK